MRVSLRMLGALGTTAAALVVVSSHAAPPTSGGDANGAGAAAQSHPSADEDSLKEKHERHVGCAGIAAAAIATSHMLSSQSEKERVHADTVLSITRDKAMASGKRLGLTESDVAQAIERQKDGILQKLNAAKGQDVDKEKADLGRVLIACALVEKLEK